MHLSNEIQTRLDNVNSNVKLSSTVDRTFPDKYAFYNKPGRSFRAEFASTDKEFSIVLFEKAEKYETFLQNYENCFARGLFRDIDRLATIIDLWVDKQKDILDIKKSFPELELYDDFDIRNPNIEIDKAWTMVKNRLFNETDFWEYSEWKNRYLKMLIEAKNHKAFENYFPFMSHYWLRFSIDKELKETWDLTLFIIPTMYSEQIPETMGKFYVSYNDKTFGGKFFETVNEALDFYAIKLKEIAPTKWTR